MSEKIPQVNTEISDPEERIIDETGYAPPSPREEEVLGPLPEPQSPSAN